MSSDFSADGFFDLLRLVEDTNGIALPDETFYLALGRLHPIMSELRLPTLGALARTARAEPGGGLLERIVDAVATRETSFFREPAVFEYIRDAILPRLLERRGRARIWSAACATGQEPYSLAMVLLEANVPLQAAESPIQLLATDISAPALCAAVSGSYDEDAISHGLSAERRERFFERNELGLWQIRAALRSAVRFQRANLLEDPRALGRFDLVLLRNVLPCFAEARRGEVLENVARSIQPAGYLILGGSEILARSPDGFDRVPHLHRAIFRRRDGP